MTNNSDRRSGWPSQDKDIMNIICWYYILYIRYGTVSFQYAFLVLFACFMSGLFIDC